MTTKTLKFHRTIPGKYAAVGTSGHRYDIWNVHHGESGLPLWILFINDNNFDAYDVKRHAVGDAQDAEERHARS